MRIGAGSRSLIAPTRLCDARGISVGVDADWDELERASAAAQREPASADAARYLGAAERTVAGLSAYLMKRGYLRRVVEAVVARAEEHGWVDDARYASMFAASRPGLGRSRLMAELIRRGVSRATASRAVEGRSDADAVEALIPLLKRRYGNLPREAALRRAAGFLARRGLSGAEAFRAAGRILSAEGGDEES